MSLRTASGSNVPGRFGVRAICSGSGGSSSGGGAQAAPAITGNPTLGASWDFGDISKYTTSSGAITTLAPSDSTAYTVTSVGTGPTPIVRNGQLTALFTGSQLMQIATDCGVQTAGACTFVIICEPTSYSNSNRVLDIGNTAAAYSHNRHTIGWDSTGFTYEKDANAAQGITAGQQLGYTGVRCLIGRSPAASSAAICNVDGQANVVAATVTTPGTDTMNMTSIGAQDSDGGIISSRTNGYVTRILVYLSALSDAQVTQIFNWAVAKYNAIGTPIAPAALNSPVITPLAAGATSVTITPGQMAGFPTPTATYSLYKNSVLVSSNYTSGATIAAVATGDLIDVTQVMSSTSGTANAPAVQVKVDAPIYFARAAEAPVVGKPLYYEVALVSDLSTVYSGAVTSQQWYRNGGTGNGMQLISGATGTTYTPTSSDVGYYIFPRVTLASGVTYMGAEFGAVAPTNTVGVVATIAPITDTTPAIGTRPSGNTGTGWYVANGELYNASNNKRRPRGFNGVHFDSDSTGMYNTGANIIRMGFYMDQDWTTVQKPLLDKMIAGQVLPVVAPQSAWSQFTATVSGTTATVSASAQGNIVPGANLFGGGTSLTGSAMGIVSAFGTSTGKTGTFTIVPTNVSYPTALTTGTSTAAGSNAITATIVSSVLNVTAFTTTINVGDYIWNGSTSLYCKISSQGTGTGGLGTYNLVSDFTGTTFGSATSMTTIIGGTGASDPRIPLANVQTLVDQYSNWSTYDTTVIFDLMNEWGSPYVANALTGSIASSTLTVTSSNVTIYPGMWVESGGGTILAQVSYAFNGTGTGSTGTYPLINVTGSGGTTFADVTWRETYKTAVTTLRTAGYKAPLIIDAPGSGQDNGNCLTLATHALAVFNADPQKNIIFTPHIYGAYTVAGLAPALASLGALRVSNGLAFAAGEFGPGRNIGPSPATIDPRQVMAQCEANNLGWIAWGWDDPANATSANFFAMCLLAGSYTGRPGYNTLLASDLTPYGQAVVLNPVYGTSVLNPTHVAYNFETDTVGSAPANVTTLNGSGMLTVSSGATGLTGKYIHCSATSQTAAEVLSFTKLQPSSNDQTLAWRRGQSSAGAVDGFILRAQAGTSVTGYPGMLQGYIFMTIATSSMIRIYKATSTGLTNLGQLTLTIGSYTYFRGSTRAGKQLFEYSSDGVSWTTAVSLSDTTFSTGQSTIQYINGLSGNPSTSYIDDVVLQSAPTFN